MSLVYLVVVLSDGRRGWYVGSDTRLDEFKRPIQFPLFDDETAKQVSLEFALDARPRWSDFCQQRFGSDLHISLDKYGPFIEEDRPAASTGQDNRVPMFVFTQGDQFGYTVIPVTPPTGPAWCLKFSDPRLAEQSVFADSPEATVAKARQMGFLELEPPQPSPFKARKEAEARVTSEKNRIPANLRPGDRR